MMKFAEKQQRMGGRPSKSSANARNRRKDETAVATARAQVMVYDDAIKKWVPSGSTGTQGIAKVQLFQHVENHTFRVVGRKVQDHEVVLNCSIVRGLKYNQATPTFHQWRDQRQVYGLNFTTAEDAANFSALMLQALDFLAGFNDHGNHLTNGVGGAHSTSELNGGGYQQQAVNSPHHVHSTPNFRQQPNGNGQYYDDDVHDGIVPPSAAQQQANFRKSSQPQNHQRRASQGSCGSSGSTPSTNNLIYATGTSPSRAAPPAPPPPPAVNGARPGPASTSAPPAPPPPPPPSALCSKGSNERPNGLAEQIKATQLRKTSAPLSHGESGAPMSVARESRTPSIGSVDTGTVRSLNGGSSGGGSGGGGNLMSELAATINRRKNLAESKPTEEPDGSGGAAKQTTEPTIRRPWEGRNGNGTANGTSNGSAVESPKTHRKVPSGSSLSSQEEQNRTTPVTANGGPTSPSTLTTESLDRWKQELLNEVRGEIAKAKNDIIEAVRAELRR